MEFQSSSGQRWRHALVAASFAALLSGCSGPAPGAAPSVAPPTESPPVPGTANGADAEAGEGATVGGDGSGIQLAPLTVQDIEAAALSGELACSFTVEGGALLLLARGDVASEEPSRGVVKVGSYVEPVSALGGFDAMLEGARFAGAGKTVGIVLAGPATGGGESPARPATLTYDRADGARREFAGQWQCGP